MTNDPILKALRQSLRSTSGERGAKLIRVYNRNLLKMHRAVKRWMKLTANAIRYGLETQLIQGKEPIKEAMMAYKPYRPKSMFEKVRVTNITSTLADWNCIRMKGNRRLGSPQMRIYGEAMGKSMEIARFKGSFNLVNQRAVDWAAQNTARMVTGITAETRAGLRVFISEGIKDGKGLGEIAAQIRTRVGVNRIQAKALVNLERKLIDKGLSPTKIAREVNRKARLQQAYRAEMIARTETANAVSAGTLGGYDESGVEMVRFEASADACEICSFLDGNKYTIREADGMIPAHPNCRCTWVPVIGSHKKV